MRPESRIDSAISFGVFWRSAPSISAIMRSTKEEPGAAVMRTLIQSDSTCVPPVTAERSPPDSRMTGADSPVMALSLTEAMPSTTSPSPGISSPASTRTRSPTLRSVAGMLATSKPPSERSLRAVSCDLVRRRLSACALPRPSATASAKLANNTVNQSQIAIWPEKSGLPPAATRSRRNISVTSAATTSVTKMTGLRISLCGASLTKACPRAGHRMAGSKSLWCTAVDMNDVL